MAVSLIARGGGAVVFLMTVGWLSSPTFAQENLVATYGEIGTRLAFKVPDAVVQKFLPEGWQVSASNGENLFVNFGERFVVTETMGSHLPARAVVLSILAKKEDVGSTVPMTFAALISDATYVPGRYGTNAFAKARVERIVRIDADGPGEVTESWEFNSDDGTYMQLQLEYVPWAPGGFEGEFRAYSATKPNFYLINKVKGVSQDRPVESVKKYLFKASGPKFSQIFDGSERLTRFTMVPWLSRQIYTQPAQ
jgi:hypothetical protein